MPLEILSSKQAWRTARNNQFARYPKPEAGAERLYPIPKPEAKASFQIGPEYNIFTMGSCFALEVDRALTKAEYRVTSRSTSLAARVERQGRDESLFNKYTIQSILNEARWALDPAQPYPGLDALVETKPGLWTDLQLGGSSFEGTAEEMLEFREIYGGTMRNLASADLVILTLGLVEAWFDRQSRLYLNMAPSRQLCEKWPKRFELHVMRYPEILRALEEFHSLVIQHGKPGVRFLITVSPVPLLLTFRNRDVLLANSYSKSVQRAVVEDFVIKHDDVDYFPSYETVALGNPSEIWTGRDFRHVCPSLIGKIMRRVLANYTRI